MRAAVLMAVLLATACAEAPAPVPGAGAQAQPSSSGAAATPAPVAPRAARRTGEPGPQPFDIGGAGEGPVMPSEVSPAFRDF
jgi:hypothetical protein